MKTLALLLALLGAVFLGGCPDKKPESSTPAASAEPASADKSGSEDKSGTDKSGAPTNDEGG